MKILKKYKLFILVAAVLFFGNDHHLYACSDRFDGGSAPPPPPCCNCEGLCTYSPTFVMSGNYKISNTDLQLPTRGFPLEITRNYESQRYVDGSLGFGGSSNLISRVTYTTDKFTPPSTYYNEAVVLMPDGMINRFRENANGSFTPPVHRKDTLVRNADGTFDLTLQLSRTKYHYSDTGKILTMTDVFNNSINYSYDGNGRLTQISDGTGSGRNITFGYGPNGRISSATDSAGRSVYYDYNSDGSLKKFTDALARETHYDYEPGRYGPRLISIRDHWNRTITSIGYDAKDRVISYSEKGETYTYEYLSDPTHPEYNPGNPYRTRKKNSAGQAWNIYYEPLLGQITRVTFGGYYYAYRNYNSNGSLYEDYDIYSLPNTTDPRTRYYYNSNGTIDKIQFDAYAIPYFGPEFTAYKYTYDTNFPEKVIKIQPQDWNGNRINSIQEWQYEHYPPGSTAPGALKKVIRIKENGLPETNPLAEYTYNSYGQVLTAKDATLKVTTYTYNSITGDLESVIYPKNSTSGGNPTFTYGRDSAGRVTSVTDPLGKITSYTYDSLDRVTSATLPKPDPSSPLNFATSYTYDQLDVPTLTTFTTQTDPNGRQTKQYYDQYGQMGRSVDVLLNETIFTYTKGDLTSIEDANGNITSYSYDANHRLTKTTFPAESSVPQANKEETYTYYLNGLLKSKTDRRQLVTSYIYRLASKRLLTKCYGTLDAQYLCPSGVGKIAYTYVGQKMTKVVDTYTSPSQTWNYVYDTSYRISQVQGPQTNDDLTYTYDAADRVLTYALQAGPTVTNTYYDNGSLKTTQWTPIAGQFQYNYTLNGQYSSITFPNNQHRDYLYDDQGRLTQLANIHPGPGNLATYAYGYDLDHSTGQATMLGQRSDLTASVPSQSFSNDLTKYYYDNNYQLKKTDYPNVVPFNAEVHQWTYDPIGNRLTNTIDSTTQNYTYYQNAGVLANGQRLQSDETWTYTYDFNGNLASDGTNTFTWNRNNLPTAISGGTTASYKYDYLGRRYSKTVNGQTTTYIYEGQNLIAERGASVADFLFGPGIDEPLAMSRSSVIYYYNVDGLGSAALVNDTNGVVQDKYVYDSWGVVRSSTQPVLNSFGYTAREFSEVGLMYYRARYYNPNIGRFVSEDPAREHEDFSAYVYVVNQPVVLKDPTGMTSSTAIFEPPRKNCRNTWARTSKLSRPAWDCTNTDPLITGNLICPEGYKRVFWDEYYGTIPDPSKFPTPKPYTQWIEDFRKACKDYTKGAGKSFFSDGWHGGGQGGICCDCLKK